MTLYDFHGFSVSLTDLARTVTGAHCREKEASAGEGSTARVVPILRECIDRYVTANRSDPFLESTLLGMRGANDTGIPRPTDDLRSTRALLDSSHAGQLNRGIQSFMEHLRVSPGLTQFLYPMIIPDPVLSADKVLWVGVQVMIDRRGSTVGSLFDHPQVTRQMGRREIAGMKPGAEALLEQIAALQEHRILSGFAHFLATEGSFQYSQSLHRWAILTDEYRMEAAQPRASRTQLWEGMRDYARFLERFGRFHQAGLLRSQAAFINSEGEEPKIAVLKHMKRRLESADRNWDEAIVKPRFGRESLEAWMSWWHAMEMSLRSLWRQFAQDPLFGPYVTAVAVKDSGSEYARIRANDQRSADDILMKAPFAGKAIKEIHLLVDVIRTYGLLTLTQQAFHNAYEMYASTTAAGLLAQAETVAKILNDFMKEDFASEGAEDRFWNLIRIGGVIDAGLMLTHERLFLRVNTISYGIRREIHDKLLATRARWKRQLKIVSWQLPPSFWIGQLFQEPYDTLSERLKRVDVDEVDIVARWGQATKVDEKLRKIFFKKAA